LLPSTLERDSGECGGRGLHGVIGEYRSTIDSTRAGVSVIDSQLTNATCTGEVAQPSVMQMEEQSAATRITDDRSIISGQMSLSANSVYR
jgi:hypothetical protein